VPKKVGSKSASRLYQKKEAWGGVKNNREKKSQKQKNGEGVTGESASHGWKKEKKKKAGDTD